MKNYWKNERTMKTARCWISFGMLSIAVMLGTNNSFAEEAVNLVKNGDAETGSLENWKNLTEVISENVHSGNYCFLVQGKKIPRSVEFIPVDPARTYTLKGWFKSASEKKSRLYFGFIPYDAKKRRILGQEVNCVEGTETTLVEACTTIDTVIKIANGAKWKAAGNMLIAFKADDSGKYEDLPNRKLSSRSITKIENKGDFWEIHLKNKCGKAYPAGTKVREHVSGGASYGYTAAQGQTVPMEWTEFTGEIKGEAIKGKPYKKWWCGTKYARILIIGTDYNCKQDKEIELLIDDISMTESDDNEIL